MVNETFYIHNKEILILYLDHKLTWGYCTSNTFRDLHNCLIACHLNSYTKFWYDRDNKKLSSRSAYCCNQFSTNDLSQSFIHYIRLRYQSQFETAIKYVKNTIFTTDTDHGNIIRCRFLLFRSCNSNISSCTTSNNNKYHVYGSYVVFMSIFQLKGLPYEYDVFYLTVISTFPYIMSHYLIMH